jgi:hypothetical protein
MAKELGIVMRGKTLDIVVDHQLIGVVIRQLSDQIHKAIGINLYRLPGTLSAHRILLLQLSGVGEDLEVRGE